MYEDRLDGRVDLAFFDRKSREWRDQQSRVLPFFEENDVPLLRILSARAVEPRPF
jgi:hypothetical protein